jgi:Uma2 family endonuclease
MAVQTRRGVTAEEFESHIEQHPDSSYELIGGEIFEVTSNPYSSEIAIEIAYRIKKFMAEHGIEGHVTGEAGGYHVMDDRYAPDVAYLSAERQGTLPYDQWFNPIAPQLAVEVVSPSDKEPKLLRKVGNYLAAGTVVWVVYPPTQEVEVYAPGQAVKVYGLNDTLDGGDFLPGFRLNVSDIFPKQASRA